MSPTLRIRDPRYQIRRELGAGGMGVVYEALDQDQGMRVALKTLQQLNPKAIARFKREFRALADIVHPNLVTLYELVADDEQIFFTMELVQGVHFHRWVRPPMDNAYEPTAALGSSGDTTRQLGPRVLPTRVIPRHGRQTVPDAVRALDPLDAHRLRTAAGQLAEGVAAIHAAGMLHRDLKPNNVLVTRDGRVVILDFGLVTDIAEESIQRSDSRPLEGTAAFMSPEQGARLPLTPASDWYSVGVILYLVLTGRPPFLGGRDDVLMDKQRFEPPAPHELAPHVPPDLSALCAELLRRQPERRPSGADILRRLGSHHTHLPMRSSIGSSLSGYDILVGRERELAALQDALAAARRGRAVLAFVAGPSGMGKSRIVRGFLDGVSNQGPAVILRGRCYERESVPFKAVDSLIDALSQYLEGLPQLEVEGLMPRDALALSRVFPVLRQVDALTAKRRRRVAAPDPQELRRRAFSGLRELLARIADRVPLILAIDDLQWGDVDSAALLAALVRPPDPPPLLLLACIRSEDRTSSEFLAAFDRRLSAWTMDIRTVDVGPLSPEDARALSLLHLGERTDKMSQASEIASESQGNPFFVEELSRHVRAQTVRPTATAVSLGEVLENRLLRLPTGAGRLLSMVAVAGRPVAQSIALRAAGITDPATLSLLKAGSLVRTRAAAGVSFVESYHDRIRETAVSLLEPEDLRGHHARLATVLEAAPDPDPETLSVHLRGAGDLERAAELAAEAGHRATKALAFDRAARLYRAALDMAGDNGDRALKVNLGDALASAGRGAEAADAYLSACAGAPAAESLSLRCRACSQLIYGGHIDRGLLALDEVLRQAGMRAAATPTRALLSLLWSRTKLSLRGLRYREIHEREVPASQLMKLDVMFAAAEGLGMSDTIRAADFQGRHLVLALKIGEPGRVARALAAEVVFVSLQGVSAAARTARVLSKLDRLATRIGDPGTQGLVAGARGIAALNEGRWRDCYEACQQAASLFRNHTTRFRWELCTSRLYISFAQAMMGQVREMAAGFPLRVKEAYERGDLYEATSLRASLGFYVPLAADDPETAYGEIDEAMGRWSVGGFHLQHINALNSRLCVDLYIGDGQRALARCRDAWPALKRSLLLRTQLLRVLMVCARGRAALAAAETDTDKKHTRLARRAARQLAGEGAVYADAAARLLEAGLAHLAGDDPKAVSLLAQAENKGAACDLVLNTLAARRARGLLIGGDEGAALMADVDARMSAEGLTNPVRIAALFAPGFAM